nr:BamA/TamA family outer membrane protein [Chitinophaga costaii]
MPIRLWLYNLGHEPRGKGLNYLLRKKWGEAPVLVSSVKTQITSDLLQHYLEDNGYFQNEWSAAIKNSGRKKASAIYTVQPNIRYHIKSVRWETDTSTKVGRDFARTNNKRRTLLKIHDPYSFDIIKQERERIQSQMRNNGYFFFTADNILVQVDSTNNGEVDLFVKIKDNTNKLATRAYYMHDITIYPDYSLTDSTQSKGPVTLYKNFRIIDPNKEFKPIVFDRTMVLLPDSLYRLRKHDATLQRLVSLGTFKFIKAQFRPFSRDSSLLNASFYLTPYPKHSLQFELRGTSKSNNFVGSEIAVSAKNRNWLHSATLLELNLSAGFEVQNGGQSIGKNSYTLKGEVAATFPRFITPFRINPPTPYVPRTRLSTSYELWSQQDLYKLNSFTLQAQYLWKQTRNVSHVFSPISITFVLPTDTTSAYDSIIHYDPSQKAALEKQFILGSNYTITFNNQSDKRVHGFYISANADVAGNLAGLFLKKNQGDTAKALLGVPIAQYIRFQLDGRYYWKLSKGITWVNRVFAGYGLPYGNSQQLPFVKQYFTGGANSLRAFRARTLGPGAYRLPDSVSRYIANESGDIKLELNSELRMHLVSVVNAALFVDAGNIWTQKYIADQPGSQFHFSNFGSQMAVGTGIGLRVDASIVVVRLDLGIPLRKPWLDPGQRWVINKINFGDSDWRKENMVLNIAIGYPF